MSKHDRLAHLMNEQTRVKVTNPAFPHIPWVGTIIGLTENPSMVLQQADSFRVTLPQAFAVEPASKAPSSPVETMGADPGTPSLPATGGRWGRSERTNTYLDAISALSPLGKPEHWVKLSTRLAIAEACMAVTDAEQKALRATLERRTNVAVRLEGIVAEQEAEIAFKNDMHGRLWDVIQANGAMNSRLLRERDEALADRCRPDHQCGRDAALAACQEHHPAGRDLPDAVQESLDRRSE